MKPGKKYILFGPPSVGKSSLIRLLPTTCIGATAIDLERVNIHDRASFIRRLADYTFTGPLFIAAADLELWEIPTHYDVVFLFPANKEEYLAYVKQQKKPNQNEAAVYDGMVALPRDRFVVIIDPRQEAKEDQQLANVLLQRLGLGAA